MKNAIITIWFNIGVNVIGLPQWHKHEVYKSMHANHVLKSKFHK